MKKRHIALAGLAIIGLGAGTAAYVVTPTVAWALGTVDTSAIREALAKAEHIAAIERVVDAQERRQRTVVRQDTSLQDAVVRYLIRIAQHQEQFSIVEEDGSIRESKALTREHIEVFRTLSPERRPYGEVDKEMQDAKWRPLWSDAPAVYWIERLANCIVHNVLEERPKGSRTAILDSLSSPGELFDPYLYHAQLRLAREKLGPLEDAVAGPDESDVPDLAPEEPQKLRLPVDEFEETILQSVRKNRVTIIQGDTGCVRQLSVNWLVFVFPLAHTAVLLSGQII